MESPTRRKAIKRYDALKSIEIVMSNSQNLLIKTMKINGMVYFDMRRWLKWKQDGVFHPSKGITLPLDTVQRDLLPALMELLGEYNESVSVKISEVAKEPNE